MRVLFSVAVLAVLSAASAPAQELAPEEILPAYQDIYSRGMACVDAHTFDGTEPNRPAPDFCDGVVGEMNALTGTGAYHRMSPGDRSCTVHLTNALFGTYDIRRLEAGGGPGLYGRTPRETEALIAGDVHQIGALGCAGG